MKLFANGGIQLNLEGRVALITGGARMGEAIARRLAENGASIVITYRRSKDPAQAVQKLVERAGKKAWIYSCDVAKQADVRKLIKNITKEIGRLDIIVNLASTFEKTPWRKLNERSWQEQLDNNAKGVFSLVWEAAPLLRKFKGRVVNFADWVVASGRPNYKDFIPYYAAKSAVLGLTQAQALELAPDVLVNAIAPGPILPPKGATAHEIKQVARATPLMRWGGADEIAKAVLFLCETDFVTGECIRVDGGRHLY